MTANSIVDLVKDTDLVDLLEKFKELDLRSHYDFKALTESKISNADELARFIESNKPFQFKFKDSNEVYYVLKADEEEKLFDIDVTTSFSKSDSWLYDKIIPVSSVFPNASSVELSDEMTNFFLCLVISSVFQEEFVSEIKEVGSNYNFTDWSPAGDDDISFSELATSWVQIGSKYIKLVAAAARYALLREKQKKRAPSVLQLPEEMVLKLNKTMKQIDAVRFDYDEVKLSRDNRASMTNLEIKVVIADRDKKIQELLQEDTQLYQVWRLLHMNSNLIPPNYLLKFNRESRKEALNLFKKIKNKEGNKLTRDERIEVKKIESQLKKTLRRAYLNKLFTEEAAKFVNSPETYIAPNFV